MAKMINGRGPFHWRDGWHWQGLEDGTVEVWHGDESGPSADALRIPATEWASIVAHVSARGETGETYYQALRFHGGE